MVFCRNSVFYHDAVPSSDRLVQGELKEDPGDLLANLFLQNTRTVAPSRVSTGLFLIVHGEIDSRGGAAIGR